MRLDYREEFPSGMEKYLSFYGWHFSKRMCEWASEKMYKEDEEGRKEYITPYTKESLLGLMKTYGVRVPLNYDSVYIANMCKADFLGEKPVENEEDLIWYVKKVMSDPDGYDGLPFTRFYADCIGSGTPIDWEDAL